MILPEWTISELQEKMESGELTARQLAGLYLQRIEAVDKSGPYINSIIELNPDALALAEKLDEERKAGKVRGALHGIPILIKDNIDTHDRMQTTAGSLALEGNIAAQDAHIVKQLRKAGALILGKTNLSEWANFRGKPSVSGWSSRGGLTRNPHALDRSACGSSSGSGAAVAANLCIAAVGTETDGSIICPSQTNGIVGIKPTLGLLSRSGIIPISHSQDTPGPMARTVRDAAILLGAMTGADKTDPATRSGRKRALRDYSKSFDYEGLKGARIGVARNMAGSNPKIIKIFELCLEVMKQLGAVIVDPADVPNFDKFSKTEVEVLHYEFKADLNKYLKALGEEARVHSLEDVIRFNEENADRVMPYFGQEHMLAAQAKGPLSEKKYRDALAKNHRLTRKEGLDAAFRKHKLDAIVVPSGGPAWMIDLANGDALNWDMESTSPPAVAGYPHITVPAGFLFGLPVGISFIAKAWQEADLIKYAYAFEQATQYRRQPRYLPTANLNP
ncbi:MAG: amidase [Anaerolineales bacterium]|nr:amidase [Anaerolineae bacterium]PWB73928.1 MAG: amidase [Anaerolineales bacterium]